MEMEKEIRHRFHDHPLLLVGEKQRNDQSKEAKCCFGCREAMSFSSSYYSCVDCNYHLHVNCAHAPYKIKHPLHYQHSGFFLRESPRNYYLGYACALCKEKRNMFFYECHDCYFAFDITCALLSHKVGENIYEFKDIDGHQYPFIFFENHQNDLKKVNCSWCHEPLIDSTYFSVNYNIAFHKKCFIELPTEIDHPCHRLHTLVLQFDVSDFFCQLCQRNDSHNFVYRCFASKFDIHLECLWSKPIVKDEKYHEHPFTLLYRTVSFICDACGMDGKFVSYICCTCHLQVHKNCISLPRIIKVSRHDHVLFHKYSLKQGGHEKHECQICFDEVKAEHGSYQCLKQDCNYIAHVKCATEDDDLYYIVDQENQDEGKDSSSFSVIKLNEHGKATQIKHFIHEEHNLDLAEIMKKDIDRQCDGCMLSISSTPYYSCSKCNFFLHKTCAELPKIKHHWFHRFDAILERRNMFLCDFCNHRCSGFLYKSRSICFCLRCAIVPNIIKHQGHRHSLFFDHKCKKQCNACGVGSMRGAFRCKRCSFALDFACITLPLEIQHNCDDHLLQLAYDGDENDGDEEKRQCCAICEEKRDSNLWYYHCKFCDKSIHPKCGLGEASFLKDGITWWSSYHGHCNYNLIFVRKVNGYFNCVICGKLCKDQALKCPTCFKFVHFKCRYDVKCSCFLLMA